MQTHEFLRKIAAGKIDAGSWIGTLDTYVGRMKPATFGKLQNINVTLSSVHEPIPMQIQYQGALNRRYYFDNNSTAVMKTSPSLFLSIAGDIFTTHGRFASEIRTVAARETYELRYFLDTSKMLYENPEIKRLPTFKEFLEE